MISSHKVDWFDFFVLAISKFVEPDPIPWFKTWSTGKWLVFLWTLFSLFIVFFFQSNLRSLLMVNDYEKTFASSLDIVQSNRTVYIIREHLSVKLVI